MTENIPPWVLDVHVACTLFLTGLIWIVQLVHYPSFRFINPDSKIFISFTNFHVNRISLIVAPAMLGELLSACLLFYLAAVPNHLSLFNLFTIGAIWLSTLLLSIPCHAKLSQGYDLEVIKRLVVSNWPRTLLWSLRAVTLIVWLRF